MDSPRVSFDYRISLGTVIHLAVLIVTIIGFFITVAEWKTASEIRLANVEVELSEIRLAQRENQVTMAAIGERLSLMEGETKALVKDPPRAGH